MRGGDHDAGTAVHDPGGVGKFGGGVRASEGVGVDAVGIEDRTDFLGEFLGMEAGIKGNGHASLLSFLAVMLQNEVCHSDGGFLDDERVHPVGAWPHLSPQSCRAEGEVGPEHILQFVV